LKDKIFPENEYCNSYVFGKEGESKQGRSIETPTNFRVYRGYQTNNTGTEKERSQSQLLQAIISKNRTSRRNSPDNYGPGHQYGTII